MFISELPKRSSWNVLKKVFVQHESKVASTDDNENSYNRILEKNIDPHILVLARNKNIKDDAW